MNKNGYCYLKTQNEILVQFTFIFHTLDISSHRMSWVLQAFVSFLALWFPQLSGSSKSHPSLWEGGPPFGANYHTTIGGIMRVRVTDFKLERL